LEEGSIEGGIIVQDCVQLMQHLLKYNASNQSLFRETNCIKQVPKMLSSFKEVKGAGVVEMRLSDPSNKWNEQKEANCSFVVELIRILLAGNNQNSRTNQVSFF
jgi:hypothetical protein